MDKVKFEKAKELEYKIFELQVLTTLGKNKFCFVDNWNDRNIGKFPEHFNDKIQEKIIELIKNEISLLEEEFNSL